MKSVLVTGCSDGGIGSALALTFAQRGLLVFAAARTPSKMSKLENLPNVRLITLDILKPEDIRAATAVVSKETGGTLDYLINNAAQARYMPLLDEDPDVGQAKELFELNVWSQLRVVQAFTPLLIAAKGTAVYISSLSGYMNLPYNGLYAASKRAAEVMFDTLRLELAPFGVTVTSVVTGPVKSAIHTHDNLTNMPENSLYADVQDLVMRRSKGEDGSPRMDTMQYANGVVNKVLKGGNAKIWSGANMWILRLIVTWMPISVLDMLASIGTGVDTLAKNNKE